MANCLLCYDLRLPLQCTGYGRDDNPHPVHPLVVITTISTTLPQNKITNDWLTDLSRSTQHLKLCRRRVNVIVSPCNSQSIVNCYMTAKFQSVVILIFKKPSRGEFANKLRMARELNFQRGWNRFLQSVINPCVYIRFKFNFTTREVVIDIVYTTTKSSSVSGFVCGGLGCSSGRGVGVGCVVSNSQFDHLAGCVKFESSDGKVQFSNLAFYCSETNAAH